MPRPREFDEEAVLRKAMETFWTRGFEATSISDLTESMGLSRSSLYASFGDKDAVFARVVDLYMREISAERVRILRNAPSVREGVEQFFEHHIRFATDPRTPAGCLVVNSALEIDSIADETAEKVTSRTRIVDVAMRELLEREIYDKERAKSLALMLVAVSYGIHVMARMHRDRKTLQAIAAAALAALEEA